MRKVILLWFCLIAPAHAQVPTGNLVEQYDMVTITGGTTLVDQSGNSNNGTLHGTTPGPTGIAFNGASDYIVIPSVVANSDFTTFICASSNGSNGNIWTENNTASGTPLFRLGANGGTLRNDGTNVYSFTSTANGMPAFFNDNHCFYLRRRGAELVYGIPDLNIIQALNIGNIASNVEGSAAIGAQNYTGVTNSYFTGTIQYAYVYTRALSTTEIANLYNATRTTLASRGVFMRDLVTSVFPGRVWQRQGRISSINISGSDNQILYTTTDCTLIGNPCFQLWFSGTAGIYYAEAPDTGNGPGNFTISGSPTTIISGYDQLSVTKVTGQSYKYLLMATPNVAGVNIDAFTSNDPIHFTLAKSAAVPQGGPGAWDHVPLANSKVFQLGSTLYLAYEANGAGCGGATSTDGLNWTKSSANPISGNGDGQSCSGPFLWNNPNTGIWYMWTHDGSAGNSGLFRRQSSIFNAIWNVSSPGAIWTVNSKLSPFPIFPADAPDETPQIATLSMVEVKGKVYMVYAGADASNVFFLKMAIAPMPLSALVQTGEGETSPQP